MARRSEDTPVAEDVITSVAISHAVREAMKPDGTAGVQDVADRTGLAKSTVHKHLQTLIELGDVYKQDGKYHLSGSLLSYVDSVVSSLEHYEPVTEALDRLAGLLEEPVFYFVPESDHCVCVYVTGDEGEYQIGDRLPLQPLAPGTAILSTYDGPTLQSLGIDPATFDPERPGGLFDDEEGHLAMAILDRQNDCLGAMVVCCPPEERRHDDVATVSGQMKAIQSEIKSGL